MTLSRQRIHGLIPLSDHSLTHLYPTCLLRKDSLHLCFPLSETFILSLCYSSPPPPPPPPPFFFLFSSVCFPLPPLLLLCFPLPVSRKKTPSPPVFPCLKPLFPPSAIQVPPPPPVPFAAFLNDFPVIVSNSPLCLCQCVRLYYNGLPAVDKCRHEKKIKR